MDVSIKPAADRSKSTEPNPDRVEPTTASILTMMSPLGALRGPKTESTEPKTDHGRGRTDDLWFASTAVEIEDQHGNHSTT